MVLMGQPISNSKMILHIGLSNVWALKGIPANDSHGGRGCYPVMDAVVPTITEEAFTRHCR